MTPGGGKAKLGHRSEAGWNNSLRSISMEIIVDITRSGEIFDRDWTWREKKWA